MDFFSPRIKFVTTRREPLQRLRTSQTRPSSPFRPIQRYSAAKLELDSPPATKSSTISRNAIEHRLVPCGSAVHDRGRDAIRSVARLEVRCLVIISSLRVRQARARCQTPPAIILEPTTSCLNASPKQTFSSQAAARPPQASFAGRAPARPSALALVSNFRSIEPSAGGTPADASSRPSAFVRARRAPLCRHNRLADSSCCLRAAPRRPRWARRRARARAGAAPRTCGWL